MQRAGCQACAHATGPLCQRQHIREPLQALAARVPAQSGRACRWSAGSLQAPPAGKGCCLKRPAISHEPQRHTGQELCVCSVPAQASGAHRVLQQAKLVR